MESAPERLRRAYLGPIGVEFMHIPDPGPLSLDRRADGSASRRRSIRPRLLEQLVRAELFEQVLQSHYVGTKRFSLEGMTALIPLLDEAIRAAAGLGAEQAVIGMSHRGRLNVIVHIRRHARAARSSPVRGRRSAQRPGRRRREVPPGRHRRAPDPDGSRWPIELVSNPSHLEAVDPVAAGPRARPAGPARRRRPATRVLPILLHGDAAFAGQGIAAETLNLSRASGILASAAPSTSSSTT